MKIKAVLDIDVRMVPCKLASYIANILTGGVVPFLFVFFGSIGMTGVQSGLLTAMVNTTCIIAGPAWAFVADKTKRRKLVLVLLCVGSAVIMFIVPWIPLAVAPLSEQCKLRSSGAENVTSVIANNVSLYLNGNLLDIKNLTSLDVNKTQNILPCDETESDRQKLLLFHVLIAISLIVSMFFFPLFNFCETLLMNVAKQGTLTLGGKEFGELSDFLWEI